MALEIAISLLVLSSVVCGILAVPVAVLYGIYSLCSWVWGSRSCGYKAVVDRWRTDSDAVDDEDVADMAAIEVVNRRKFVRRTRNGVLSRDRYLVARNSRGFSASHACGLHLQATFGLMKDSPANRMVLGKEARRWCQENGVRKVDYGHVATLGVEFALIPRESDEIAANLRRSSHVRSLKERYGPDF
jgi:hypothetical protein